MGEHPHCPMVIAMVVAAIAVVIDNIEVHVVIEVDGIGTPRIMQEIYGKPGHTWLIVNGYYCSVDAWNGHGALIGDWVEVIHDSSVKRVVSFELDQRITFTSTLDSAAKYLLHYCNSKIS
jgi:hypothetical protein